MREVGNIINSLKEGKPSPTKHHNPYLELALTLSPYLYTSKEIQSDLNILFAKPELPCILEIGCYLGKTLNELSLQNKELNFFGIDITYKRVVKTASKLKKANLSNARVGMADGRMLAKHLASLGRPTLQGLIIFFPDPWLKSRQEKHRLMNQEFLSDVQKIILPEGFIWIKTDQKNYFLEAVRFAQENHFTCYSSNTDGAAALTETGIEFSLKEELDPIKGPQPKELSGGPFETIFQSVFMRQNLPYYEAVLRKNK